MAILKTRDLMQSDQQSIQKIHNCWQMRSLPASAKPYAELLRIHKPAGIAMFYLPCLYGTFLVGLHGPARDFPSLVLINSKLLLLSFLLRGTLCTWNDLLDQDIDRQVARTRIRPIARGAVSSAQALIFTISQGLLVAACFRTMPLNSFRYALPFLALHIAYPLAKRSTHHPQLVLGFAHSLGIFIAFPALGQELPRKPRLDSPLLGALSLGLAIVFWTVLNDTIYAAQDLEDDKKASVGSTMIYWEQNAKVFLRILAVLTVAALLVVGVNLKSIPPYHGIFYNVLTCGGTAVGLLLMVEWVNLKDPVSCGWWFNRGNVLVGVAIASGIVGEYIAGGI